MDGPWIYRRPLLRVLGLKLISSILDDLARLSLGKSLGTRFSRLSLELTDSLPLKGLLTSLRKKGPCYLEIIVDVSDLAIRCTVAIDSGKLGKTIGHYCEPRVVEPGPHRRHGRPVPRTQSHHTKSFWLLTPRRVKVGHTIVARERGGRDAS